LAVFFCCRARATGRARQSAKTQLRERARGVTGARVTGARERGRDKGFWLVATKISREINSRRRPCARDSRVAPALCSAGGRRPCSLLLQVPARPLLRGGWPSAALRPPALCSCRCLVAQPSAQVSAPAAYHLLPPPSAPAGGRPSADLFPPQLPPCRSGPSLIPCSSALSSLL
jgi:hypothetical protein